MRPLSSPSVASRRTSPGPPAYNVPDGALAGGRQRVADSEERGTLASTSHAATATEIDDATVDAMIAQDPHRPGRHNARFVEYGHHVWAIIAYLQGTGW